MIFLKRYKKGRDSQQGKLFPSFGSLFNHRVLLTLKEFGIQNCLGIDGEYVDRAQLQISPNEFLALDLNLPVRLDKSFDLVLYLEVAEHLPSESADIFI